MLQTVLYNGSFEGFFTAVFEVYEYKFAEPDIQIEGASNISLFSSPHVVTANTTKAERVLKALQQKITTKTFGNFYRTFLSELPGIENVLYRFIKYVLSAKDSVERNFANPDVLMIQQTAHKVDREKHRMKAFIRFQQTKDELYYAIVQPDFNVLPLISDHFEKRYADQRWLIYDTRRKYGLYYDGKTVEEVKIDFSETLQNAASLATIHDEKEDLYQSLWQSYFDSVNIKARKNTKLHIQHMPKRYWRYLVEKQPR